MYNLGPDRVPDDAGLRLHGAAEPVLVVEAVDDRRDRSARFLQDRATAIAGRLGPGPDADAGHADARQSERGASAHVQFDVVRDQLFTPLMTYSALLQHARLVRAAVRRRDLRGRRARRRCKDHGAIAFDNLFSGDTPRRRRVGLRRRAAHRARSPTTTSRSTVERLDLHDHVDRASRRRRRSSASGSTIRVRAPAAPCR